MKTFYGEKKYLGETIYWKCPVCGKLITCHTTTRLRILQHKRMHVRKDGTDWSRLPPDNRIDFLEARAYRENKILEMENA